MVDRLTKIPVSDLGKLKDLLHTDFPRHLVGYGLVATLEEWYQQTSEVEHINVLTLNDDWMTDGLVLVTVSKLHIMQMPFKRHIVFSCRTVRTSSSTV